MDLPTTNQKGTPAAGARPTVMNMELWVDMSESIPLSLTMQVGDAMDMDMEFTHIQMVEPALAEFKIPDDYADMKLPSTAATDAPVVVKAAPAAAK